MIGNSVAIDSVATLSGLKGCRRRVGLASIGLLMLMEQTWSRVGC